MSIWSVSLGHRRLPQGYDELQCISQSIQTVSLVLIGNTGSTICFPGITLSGDEWVPLTDVHVALAGIHPASTNITVGGG